MKWLRRLRFESTESTNFYHATEYRVPRKLLEPGEPFEFTLANSIPTWKIRLMRFILSPEPSAELKAGSHKFSGVAFNDGDARLQSLLVSFDRGQSGGQPISRRPPAPTPGIRGPLRRNLSRAPLRFGAAQLMPWVTANR